MRWYGHVFRMNENSKGVCESTRKMPKIETGIKVGTSD
jgi:hypothetical protein